MQIRYSGARRASYLYWSDSFDTTIPLSTEDEASSPTRIRITLCLGCTEEDLPVQTPLHVALALKYGACLHAILRASLEVIELRRIVHLRHHHGGVRILKLKHAINGRSQYHQAEILLVPGQEIRGSIQAILRKSRHRVIQKSTRQTRLLDLTLHSAYSEKIQSLEPILSS
ncbi:hypothetical protein A0H81_13610 [Grifola frondosa]|uniref:Uncharacterized protein n=1 Tax=Grifola frondosa TaxID=5627 RepID=A0A1C7LNR9_GRIFR|nr:hypothetical protein A0H81_13610 [Grifola frondosa]